MQVWYEVLGADVKAIGTLSTNDDGCFYGTLSGITVPKETTIKVGPLMSNSNAMVTTPTFPYPIYNYQFSNAQTVGDGEAADFGGMGISESLGDDHGVFLMALNAEQGIDLYESKIEPWSGYGNIAIRYPELNTTPNANGSRIVMTTEYKHNFTAYLHEWGHWLAFRDAAFGGFQDSYCEDYAGTSYPYNQIPCLYKDPDRPDCTHYGISYEGKLSAAIEGFAEFYAGYLLEAGVDKYGLNFDGQNREYNARDALLDFDADCRAVSLN